MWRQAAYRQFARQKTLGLLSVKAAGLSKTVGAQAGLIEAVSGKDKADVLRRWRNPKQELLLMKGRRGMAFVAFATKA